MKRPQLTQDERDLIVVLATAALDIGRVDPAHRPEPFDSFRTPDFDRCESLISKLDRPDVDS